MISTSSIDQEELMATLYAMRQQEEIYVPDDYLQNMENNAIEDNTFNASMPIDEDWRCKMVEWSYSISDHFELDRNTVAVAMNIFDRFMSIITTEIHDEEENIQGVVYYQLAAMICLYTAVKIHEPVAFEPKIISLMSGGVYSEEQVTDMEQTILHTVQWRLNPPTPITFVHCFLSMIPIEIIDPKTGDYNAILELTKHQIELGIKDYSSVVSHASSMALAALTNAIQAIKSITTISSLTFKLEEAISNIITESNMCPESFILHQDSLRNLAKKFPPNKVNHSIIKMGTATAHDDGESSSIYGSPRGILSCKGAFHPES